MPKRKRITYYCNYATRNCNVGEIVTERKSLYPNRCDTIWDIYADKRFAPPKSPISNRCDTIWDIYTGERVATGKSPVPNNFYSFPN